MLSFPKGRDQEDVFLKSGNAMCNIDEASSYHPKYAHVFQRIHWEKGKKHLTVGPAFFQLAHSFVQTSVETKEMNSMTPKVPSNLKHWRICKVSHRQVKQPIREEDWRARPRGVGWLHPYKFSSESQHRGSDLPCSWEISADINTGTPSACATNPTNNRNNETYLVLAAYQAERRCFKFVMFEN